jgi:hypothetical protein
MEYLVRGIPSVNSANTREDGSPDTRTIEDVEGEIGSEYIKAERWGGRVIAAHTLTCGPCVFDEGELRNIKEPTDFLFVVSARPDDEAS